MTGLPRNTAFSLMVPKLQLAWDSVSLGALKTCPRYYQYAIVEGWQARQTNVHLTFGILAHSTRERYYHAKAKGSSHGEALDCALEWLLLATWDASLNRPWTSEDPNKNRFTLVRSMIWYLDQWEHDPLETVHLASGAPAVELSFAFETTFASEDGEPFVYCGHLDRVVSFNGQVFLSDLKTTKNALTSWYFDDFTPDGQFSGYCYSASVVYNIPVQGLIVDAMQVLVNGTRFQRAPVQRTKGQLAEWYEDLGQWLSLAEYYARAERWPQNDKACFRCDFRGICSKSPETREKWLAADFKKRVWDPLIARGDM